MDRLSETLGTFEFTTVAGARIARDAWNVSRNDLEIMDCLALGLDSGGHIRQRPDWSDWGNHHPFEFLLEESAAGRVVFQDAVNLEPPSAATDDLAVEIRMEGTEEWWELTVSRTTTPHSPTQ